MKILAHYFIGELRRLRWYGPVWVLLQLCLFLLSFGYQGTSDAVANGGLVLLMGAQWLWVYFLVVELWSEGSPVSPGCFWVTRPVSPHVVLGGRILIFLSHLVLPQLVFGVLFWCWLGLGREAMWHAFQLQLVFNGYAFACGLAVCLFNPSLDRGGRRLTPAFSSLLAVACVLLVFAKWPAFLGGHYAAEYGEKNRIALSLQLGLLFLGFVFIHFVRNRRLVLSLLGLGFAFTFAWVLFWPAPELIPLSSSLPSASIGKVWLQAKKDEVGTAFLVFAPPGGASSKSVGNVYAQWTNGTCTTRLIGPVQGVESREASADFRSVFLLGGNVEALSRPLWFAPASLPAVLESGGPGRLRGRVELAEPLRIVLKREPVSFGEGKDSLRLFGFVDVLHGAAAAELLPYLTPLGSRSGFLVLHHAWAPHLEGTGSVEVVESKSGLPVKPLYTGSFYTTILGVPGSPEISIWPVDESLLDSGGYCLESVITKQGPAKSYDFDLPLQCVPSQRDASYIRLVSP